MFTEETCRPQLFTKFGQYPEKNPLYTLCQIKFTDQQWCILKADNLVFGKETLRPQI